MTARENFVYTKQMLPAGLSGKGIEIFRDNEGRVFYLKDGYKLPYLLLDPEEREIFIAELSGDLTAIQVLEKYFGITDPDEQEEMFVGCRYGNLDYRADLLNGKLTHDAPRCNMLDKCKGFNIVCRIPVPKYGPLTRKEYIVVILIAQGRMIKEISDSLGITEATTRTHITNIHRKLGVNNNLEVAAWAHNNRVI